MIDFVGTREPSGNRGRGVGSWLAVQNIHAEQTILEENKF